MVDRRDSQFVDLCREYLTLATVNDEVVPPYDERLSEVAKKRTQEIRGMLGIGQNQILGALARGFKEENDPC